MSERGSYHADKFRVQSLEQELDNERLILVNELVTLHRGRPPFHATQSFRLVLAKDIIFYNNEPQTTSKCLQKDFY